MELLSRFFVKEPLHILLVAGMFFLVWHLLRLRVIQPSRRINALLVPAFAWLAYAAWEWLILVKTPEANIRVDLLLVLPIVALATLWPVVWAIFPQKKVTQNGDRLIFSAQGSPSSLRAVSEFHIKLRYLLAIVGRETSL
jgi:hypothetical protein